MSNTLLDAERFAVLFLSYLDSVGSGSEKAILQFANRGASSLTTTTDDNKNKPSSGRFAVNPIPSGFFSKLEADDQCTTLPGSWVVLLLLVQRGRSSSDNDVLLRYSFVRIRQSAAEIAPEQKQEQDVEVVGGLTDCLRETVPGIDVSRFEDAEKDLRVDIGVMAESRAQVLLEQIQ